MLGWKYNRTHNAVWSTVDRGKIMIGIIKSILSQIKKETKPKYGVKNFFSDAKGNISGPQPAVASDVDKDEFLKRYKNLFLSSYILLAIATYSLYKAFNYSSTYGLMISLLSALICLLFYFKYSFIGWRARLVYNKWNQRADINSRKFSDYFDAILDNPKEILLIKIKK